MEASEATETTAPDVNVPAGGRHTENTPLPGSAEAAEQTEAPAEQTEAKPDVGEAILEMRQQLSDLQQRVPDQGEQQQAEGQASPDLMAQLLAEVEGDEIAADEQGVPQTGEGEESDADLQALRDLIREESAASLTPYLQRMEYDRRVAAIEQIAERFPRLREEKITDAVAARLRPLASRYGNGVYTDPELVLTAYQAYEAEAAAAAQGSPEGETNPANLEQGGGPAAPEPGASVEEQQYAQVFKKVEGNDPLTA